MKHQNAFRSLGVEVALKAKDCAVLTNMIDDFDWSWTGVTVRKTGARVPFDAAHLSEVYHWFIYFAATLLSPRSSGGPVIGFLPDRARPWYLVWPALFLSGGRSAKAGEVPDVWMHFEDKTHSEQMLPPSDGKPQWNFQAMDLSKSRVAAAFETAFGYSLAIDPTRGSGEAVEKGEANGIHDGAIVQLPCVPRAGKVYQKLVDNRAPDGLVEDLRTPTVGGKPVFVYIKRRSEKLRFTNDNADCLLRTVDEIFSAEEVESIERFCQLLNLDWGGLDILRNASDGKLYIVDANRTDMGPPIALPLSDKLKSTRMLATALKQNFDLARQKVGGG